MNCKREICRRLAFKSYANLYIEQVIEAKNVKRSGLETRFSSVYSITESKQQPGKHKEGRTKTLPKTRYIFCKGNHFNDACLKVPYFESKEQRIECCMKCLRKGHSSTQCRTELRPCFNFKSEQHKSARVQHISTLRKMMQIENGKKALQWTTPLIPSCCQQKVIPATHTSYADQSRPSIQKIRKRKEEVPGNCYSYRKFSKARSIL